MNPLLSICIPTYNRAECLEKNILSITKQNKFLTGEIEIVVSDNASTDNTEAVCRKFSELYSNFKYYRNTNNEKDRNFPIVISKSTGIYRKLCNDTLTFKEEAITKLVNQIKQNIDKKPILFFANGNDLFPQNSIIRTNDLNSFLAKASYRTTWIGSFGIWAEDFDQIKNKEDGCEISLWQTKTLFDLVFLKREAIIDNTKLFYPSQTVKNKDVSYGIFSVFYTNFLSLVNNNQYQVSSKVKYKVKKDLLTRFFKKWAFNNSVKRTSYLYKRDENIEMEIIKKYFLNLYFYIFLATQCKNNIKRSLKSNFLYKKLKEITLRHFK